MICFDLFCLIFLFQPIKWSRALCSTLGSEGFWGGHTGPFFHRERFGWSFWDNDPLNNNNNAILRAKWGGALRSSLYCDPTVSGCDVSQTGPGTNGGVVGGVSSRAESALVLLLILLISLVM